MKPDSELNDLIKTWKAADVSQVQTCFSATKLAHRHRWEGYVGVALAVGIGGFSAVAAGSWWVNGERAHLALALFLVLAGIPFVRGLLSMRRATTEADAELAGSPAAVVRGYRRHVRIELQSMVGTTSLLVNAAMVVLWTAFAAYGAVPAWLAGLSILGYAAWFVPRGLSQVPKLRAELVRIDALVAQLDE